MARHNEFGKEGETIARTFLQQKGYAILESNWRSGHKEIDIIARDGNTLVVVEVKSRKQDSLVSPEETVDYRKICNLVRAADNYIALHNLTLDVRFDIVSIVPSDDGYVVDHIVDAFYPPINLR